MQRIELIGYLGQDAEVKDFNNTQVINFSVAVSESYTNKQGEKITNTNWYECSKWGNNTTVAQYLKKGQQVFVSGKPQARAWQKDDGTLVSNLGVNVFAIQLLGSKESQPQNTSQPQAQASAPQASNFEPATSNDDDDGDGLPF